MQELRLAGTIGIVDCNPVAPLRDEACHQLLGQRFAGYDDTRCLGAPEIDEMSLAASRRPVERQSSRRPIGPSVYPADGLDVAVRNQKIGSAQAYAAR